MRVKYFTFLFLVMLVTVSQSQTVLFYEDFEDPANLSVTSSGTPGWAISTHLSSSGLRSDSSTCFNPGDSSVLMMSSPINTLGYGYVILEFDHICKIEFYDAAYIEASADSGATWHRLTGMHYLGSGQFAVSGNKFTSASYIDWLPGNPTPPDNTWWKSELFDISSIVANSQNVLVRFILKDEDNQNLFDNYAWFIDDIKITAAISELTPPDISLVPPLMQGLIFSLGPFTIQANITDTSGIDTAWVVYQVNQGQWDSLPMIPGANDLFTADIPPVNDLDTINYYIVAVDASLSSNVGTYPTTGHMTFIASSGLYTPYFNDFETYDSLWIADTNDPETKWEHGYPNYGVLTGAYSGINAWTVNKDSLYGNLATATLTSPYFNFSNATDLILSFYQNRNTEAKWDGMHMEYTTDGLNWHILGTLNDPAGENWYTDTVYATSGGPAWEGTSGGWIKSSYKLGFLNNTPMVRFRFVFSSDPFITYEGVSIDDFYIAQQPDIDVAVTNVISPVTDCQLGMETVSVEIKNDGRDTVYNIPVNYHVHGAAATVTEIFTDTIPPDSTALFVFNTLLDMTVTSGYDSTFVITVYTDLPGDSTYYNDTLTVQVISGAVPNDPVPLHQTIPYATATKVTAVSNDTLFWFKDHITTTTLYVGDSLKTPVLYDSTTYWVEARAGLGKLVFTELTAQKTGLGSSNPYPPYIPPSSQWDGIEITNVGNSPVDLTGYIFHMEGFRTLDYPLPPGLILMPGELIVLTLYASPQIPPDTANNFYIANNQIIYATSQLGFWLEAPDGSVEDAFAVNGYTFNPATPVTPADWSGAIPSGMGRAGVIRIGLDNNDASDWALSNLPDPIQTIGSYNPQLDPVTALGCIGNRIPVNVNIASFPPYDAGITDIIKPVSAVGLTSAEKVKAVVKNYGTQPLNGFSVSYSLDGAAPVTEQSATVLPPGDTVHYNFLSTIDLSAKQIYNLKVWVTVTGDTVPINDTAYTNITHMLPPYCVSAANFSSLADIGEVQFGPMVNVSPVGNVTYTDFTHLPPDSFIQGITYPISVTMQPQTTSNLTFAIKVFIDLDGDGVFDPATELVLSGLTSSMSNTVSGYYTIPHGAETGLVRMRVVMRYTSNLNLVEPCGTYNYGETEDYNLIFLPPLPYDASVSNFAGLNPPLFEGTSANLSVYVKNVGSDTISDIPVAWIVDSQQPVVETASATLIPGDSIQHNFSTPFIIPEGVFTLKVFSDLPNDGYRENDTIQVSMLGEKEFTVFYFDNFENDDFNGWTPELVSLWQHGVPNANKINYAYSPTRVWATRLIGHYMNNMQSGLITPAFDFTNLSSLSIRFWHWYETEYGFDGGNVKYSTDGGDIFITLGYTNDPLGVNWYNIVASGRPAFSGSSGQWVYSSYDISNFDDYPDPVQFKFDFFSNNTITDDGWAIDDFMITVEKDSIDVGVTSIILPVNTVPEGVDFNLRVRIENFGKEIIHSIPIAYSINGSIPFEETWTGTLLPGQTSMFMFNNRPVSPGAMDIKVFTRLPGDNYTFNDTAQRTVGYVGVSNLLESLDYKIFPNPATEDINIFLKTDETFDVDWVLVDMLGRKVNSGLFSIKTGKNNYTIDRNGLKPGVYNLIIYTENGTTAARVILQ